MLRNRVSQGHGRSRLRVAGALSFAAGLAVTVSSFTAGPLAAGAVYQPSTAPLGGSAQLDGATCFMPDRPLIQDQSCVLTKLSANLVTVGTPVHDTATIGFLGELSPKTGSPQTLAPTVTFNIYSGTGTGVCTGTPVKTIGPQQVVSNSADTGSIATDITAPALTPGDYEFQAVYSVGPTTSVCGDEPLTIVAPNSQLQKLERDLGPNGTAAQDPAQPAYVGDISTALTGDVIQYQLSYANTGTAGASHVVLSDAIPAGTSYLGGSCILAIADSPFTCNDSVAGVVTFTNLAGVPSGTPSAVIGTFKVTITAPAPFTITNTATFTTGVEPLPTKPIIARATAPNAVIGPIFKGNAVAVAATGPKSSLTKGVRDLGAGAGVTPAADPATPAYASSISAVAGDVLQYQLTYTNSGSAAAKNVTVSDVVPSGATYYHPGSVTSCLPAAGWSCDDHSVPGTITLSNPSVPKGTANVVAGTFKVLTGGSGTFTVHNIAQVTTTAESTPLTSTADASVSQPPPPATPTPTPTPVSAPTVDNAPPHGTMPEAPAPTSGGVAGISVVATPTTGAEVPFGLGLVLMLLGGVLTAMASRRRPSDAALSGRRGGR